MGYAIKRKFEQYQDMFARTHPGPTITDGRKVLSRSVTFQVTDSCNLNCSYCYQINKGTRRMPFEVGKKFIDILLNATPQNNKYINPVISPAIILDFIGGEPLMEVDLIDELVTYFRKEAIKMKHPWAVNHMIGICSNGVLYNEPRVQQFLNKYIDSISFSVTLDGDKELHDSCRVFYDGSGSYDLAVAACRDWMGRGFYMGSKITIAPGNVDKLFNAMKHMLDLGYYDIHANCVFEEGWTIEHAKIYYDQLKMITNYLIDNDMVDSHDISLFRIINHRPMDENDMDNWCGGTGDMIAVDPGGVIYPCLRYMPSSLGDTVEPIIIGNVDTGIATNEEECSAIKCLHCINRRSQSTDECFNCPIATGCSWCSAYNYQTFGTPDKRATFICDMHKVEALANVYLWNSHYEKHNINSIFENNCPDEWALEIIDESELNMLKDLVNRRKEKVK